MDVLTILNIHDEIIKQLDGYYNNNQIPNIIFHGASGTGKKQIVIDYIKIKFIIIIENSYRVMWCL